MALAFLLWPRTRGESASGFEPHAKGAAPPANPLATQGPAILAAPADDYADPLDKLGQPSHSDASTAGSNTTAGQQQALDAPAALTAVPPPPTARPVARAAAPPRARRAPSSDEPDLRTILLRNIEGDSTPPAKRETLDDLVNDILKRERDQPRKNANRKEVLAEGSSELQARLRACPPANTPKGISCRQSVCARYGGTDAACPRQ